MQVTFSPGRACGEASVPPSKSVAHRLLLGAALAEGESVIARVPACDDVRATLGCLSALGVPFSQSGDTVAVQGGRWRNLAPLPCGESGSTLRFFLPCVMKLGEKVRFEAAPSLMRRPMGVYGQLFLEKGLYWQADEKGCTVCGPMEAGTYAIPGDISSQFVTGLLYALPLLADGSEIHLLTGLESRPYVELTRQVLSDFGVQSIWKSKSVLAVPGMQRFSPLHSTVAGDASASAPLLALGVLGGEVTVTGLSGSSAQPDSICGELLARLQAGFSELDLKDCPDLGPVLFAVSAMMHGGRFTGIRRLRLKESDRVECMRQEMEKMGCRMEVTENAVTIPASLPHAPDVPLFAHNDHRIAMALSLLLSRTGGVLKGAEAVNKSFPGYFDVLAHLGLKIQIA